MLKVWRFCEVVYGEHRMRLAAAERSLKPYDRIATRARKPLEAAHQHPPQSLGEKCDAKEVLGSPIVFCRMARVDREQIGRELRLLEAIGEHVRVRKSYLDPRFQPLARSGPLSCGRRKIERRSSRRSWNGWRRCGDTRVALGVVEFFQLG